MEQHHEVALDLAMDELYLQGATSILKDRLYLWFNAERLNKGAYRFIIRRWEKLCERYEHDEVPELSVLEFQGSTLNIRRGTFEGEKILPMADWA